MGRYYDVYGRLDRPEDLVQEIRQVLRMADVPSHVVEVGALSPRRLVELVRNEAARYPAAGRAWIGMSYQVSPQEFAPHRAWWVHVGRDDAWWVRLGRAHYVRIRMLVAAPKEEFSLLFPESPDKLLVGSSPSSRREAYRAVRGLAHKRRYLRKLAKQYGVQQWPDRASPEEVELTKITARGGILRACIQREGMELGEYVWLPHPVSRWVRGPYVDDFADPWRVLGAMGIKVAPEMQE